MFKPAAFKVHNHRAADVALIGHRQFRIIASCCYSTRDAVGGGAATGGAGATGTGSAAAVTGVWTGAAAGTASSGAAAAAAVRAVSSALTSSSSSLLLSIMLRVKPKLPSTRVVQDGVSSRKLNSSRGNSQCKVLYGACYK